MSYQGEVDNRLHKFQVADLGDWDLDEDRSIVPSIQFTLKSAGIDAVVDGEEMNASVFYVHTKSPRDVIKKTLEDDGIFLDD